MQFDKHSENLCKVSVDLYMSVCIRDTAFSQHCAKEVGPICSAEEMRKIPDTHIPRAFKKLLKVLRFTNLLKVPILTIS